MKFIGFIKDHHINGFSEAQLQDSGLDDKSKKEIIKYLKGGEKFAVTTHLITSLIDKSIIGGLIFFTDGFWIWPLYLPHYINHSKVKLSSEFIQYVATASKENSTDKYPCNGISQAIDFYKTEFEEYISKLG